MNHDPKTIVTIVYLNHRGKTAQREIIPYTFGMGTTEYYPTQQYLLEAYDLGKKAMRTFAMNNIIEWRGNHATDHSELVKSNAVVAHYMRLLFPEGRTL